MHPSISRIHSNLVMWLSMIVRRAVCFWCHQRAPWWVREFTEIDLIFVCALYTRVLPLCLQHFGYCSQEHCSAPGLDEQCSEKCVSQCVLFFHTLLFNMLQFKLEVKDTFLTHSLIFHFIVPHGLYLETVWKWPFNDSECVTPRTL